MIVLHYIKRTNPACVCVIKVAAEYEQLNKLSNPYHNSNPLIRFSATRHLEVFSFHLLRRCTTSSASPRSSTPTDPARVGLAAPQFTRLD